jgi:glucan 1,3-beta-glucosidase
MTWGLRIVNSSDVYMYAGGLYSFYEDYQQECLNTSSCQDNMVDIECSSNLWLYGLTTISTVNMVTVNGQSEALGSDNVNNFGSTLALFQQ